MESSRPNERLLEYNKKTYHPKQSAIQLDSGNWIQLESVEHKVSTEKQKLTASWIFHLAKLCISETKQTT